MTEEPSQPVRLDLANALEGAVGPEHGITPSDLAYIDERAPACLAAVARARAAGELGFYDCLFDRKTAECVKSAACRIRERFENFVVLGVGGSALGASTIVGALGGPMHNLVAGDRRRGARVFVLDNIDPALMSGALEHLDPHETAFNVITKSGSTAETMAQFLIAWKWLRETLGDDFREHVIATTDPARGALREIAREANLKCFDIPPNVGGRFSVLTPVGLLPAAVAGADVDRLLAGAGAMCARCESPAVQANPALAFAAFHYIAATRKGKSISVMMPYSQLLWGLADWHRQLWAESLGKRLNRKGEIVHAGQTPVKALGATDQHSQVQLYREGPNDKIFTFLSVREHDVDVPIPPEFPGKEATAYLGGHTLGELLDAERRATAMALTQAQRPNLTLSVPRADEETLGALFFMLEAATALAGEFLDVNAFDQPGVEAGKVATYALMGRPGFEDLPVGTP